MAGAKELNARLFIEGRSVPFVSANCQFQQGQAATATIMVPPLPEVKRFKPRTMVHLFVKDQSHPDTVKPWILMFDGEIYGYGSAKSTQGRSFNLYAMDYSNYWDNAKQYHMNIRTSTGDSNFIMAGAKFREELKAENVSIETSYSGLKAYITTIVSNKLKEDNASIIDAVSEIMKKVEDINPFFRYNNYRYRINERIISKDSGNVKDLFDFSNSDDLWEALSGKGNGGLTTIRTIVNLIMNMVFHDFVSVPFPSKVGNTTKTGIGKDNNATIGSFIFKPQTFMMPPPKCNILFPDLYGELRFQRNYFHEVSRLKAQRNHIAAEVVQGQPKSALNTFFSPSQYSKFRSIDTDNTIGKQYDAESGQGNQGDKAPEDIKNTTVLQEFNFLSYEEVLKGIFSDMGSIMPSAQIFSKIVAKDKQNDFFQKATDYLFYKKRFASRAASCSGPFNPAPVPGFPILCLDDSSGEDHIIGVLNSISHSISATGGGNTSYGIGYARSVDEADLWDNDSSEPPIPPWYDPAVFGKSRDVKPIDLEYLSNEDKDRMQKFTIINGYDGTSIKSYYESILGKSDSNSHVGSQPIVSSRFPNIYAATMGLLSSYRAAKKKGTLDEFINIQTRRDYVLLAENFEYLGAEIPKSQSNVNFDNNQDIVFKGTVFDGDFVEIAEATANERDKQLKKVFGTDATKVRRDPVDAYRKRLLSERGFRG